MRELEREGGRREVINRAKVSIEWMLCCCPQCRGVNKVVFDWNNPKKYHKCQLCNEVVPLGAYRVIATTNDPHHPIF